MSDSLGPVDCSPRGSPVHGILQASILKWVAILFPRGSSRPRDQTRVSCTAGRFFTICITKVQKGLRDLPNISELTGGTVKVESSLLFFTPHALSLSTQKLDTTLSKVIIILWKKVHIMQSLIFICPIALTF